MLYSISSFASVPADFSLLVPLLTSSTVKLTGPVLMEFEMRYLETNGVISVWLIYCAKKPAMESLLPLT